MMLSLFLDLVNFCEYSRRGEDDGIFYGFWFFLFLVLMFVFWKVDGISWLFELF